MFYYMQKIIHFFIKSVADYSIYKVSHDNMTDARRLKVLI